MALSDRLPVLDDRSFDDLVAEARSRIPRYTPEWTDFNEGDAGFALVQLMAWMTELLLYRMGRVPELNYIKFLELIGIELEPARPATALITFHVIPDWADPVVEVPMRTQVAAVETDELGPIVFETDRRLVALRAQLDAVQSQTGGAWTNLSAANLEAEAAFLPFGLMPGANDALCLGFSDRKGEPPPPGIELALQVYGAGDSTTARFDCDAPRFASAALAIEHFDGTSWRAVQVLKDETLALTRSGRLLLKTPAKGLWRPSVLEFATDSPRFWLRLRVLSSVWERAPRLLAIRANTVAASHGETIEREILGGSYGTAAQTFRFGGRPVIEGSLTIEVDEGEGFKVPDHP